MAYRNSPTLFRTVLSPTPYGLLFHKIGGSQPHPKTQNPKLQSILSQERVNREDTDWPEHSQGPSEKKPIKKFGEKGAWAHPGTAQIFWIPPSIISGTGEATYGLQIWHVHSLGPFQQKPISGKGKARNFIF